MIRLDISIVTYAPDLNILASVLKRLDLALQYARQQGLLAESQLILVDNGPGSDWYEPLKKLLGAVQLSITTELLSSHGNLGYGAGHNLALKISEGDFHLILNPDVLLEEDALSVGLAFLTTHPEAGVIVPDVRDERDHRQYLCKRYPTVLDLALRGFAPKILRQYFQVRLDHYELRDRINESVLWDPPIVSGCFMLCRRVSLDQVGGFQSDYFLYFEDFDLSLRLAAITRLVYVPTVGIVHFGGHAARKGFRHIRLFVRAAILFFNQHGWRWW